MELKELMDCRRARLVLSAAIIPMTKHKIKKSRQRTSVRILPPFRSNSVGPKRNLCKYLNGFANVV